MANRRPKGWQPNHTPKDRAAKPAKRPTPRLRRFYLDLEEEAYKFLEHMAEQASRSAGLTISPSTTAEVLLMEKLHEVAESYRAAVQEERMKNQAILNELELPADVRIEEETGAGAASAAAGSLSAGDS